MGQIKIDHDLAQKIKRRMTWNKLEYLFAQLSILLNQLNYLRKEKKFRIGDKQII